MKEIWKDIKGYEGLYQVSNLGKVRSLDRKILFKNGHTNQTGDEVFDYEDVCELVALSNNSINKIVKKYLANKY